MGKYKGERLSYKQALTIAAAVETGGASLEEVYWKVKLYKVISILFREKGYTFDETDIVYMINKSYETLHDIEGFPAVLSISFDQLAKVLLDSIMEKEMENRERQEVYDEYDDLYSNYEDAEIEYPNTSKYSDEIIDEYLNTTKWDNPQPEPKKRNRKVRDF